MTLGNRTIGKYKKQRVIIKWKKNVAILGQLLKFIGGLEKNYQYDVTTQMLDINWIAVLLVFSL